VREGRGEKGGKRVWGDCHVETGLGGKIQLRYARENSTRNNRQLRGFGGERGRSGGGGNLDWGRLFGGRKKSLGMGSWQ